MRGPNEHQIQAQYFEALSWKVNTDPRLAAIYAIPNAGKRSIGGMLYYFAEGLKSGLPDVCIPIPTALRPGAYIEFKVPGAKLKPKQEYWRDLLQKLGHAWSLQTDAFEALEWTDRYVAGEL